MILLTPFAESDVLFLSCITEVPGAVRELILSPIASKKWFLSWKRLCKVEIKKGAAVDTQHPFIDRILLQYKRDRS